MPNPKTVKRNLPCKLTSLERSKLLNELAENVSRLNSLSVDKAVAITEFNTQIKSVKEIIASLSSKLETNTIKKPVLCSWKLNLPEKGLKSLVRKDTGDVVIVEEMLLFDEPLKKAK